MLEDYQTILIISAFQLLIARGFLKAIVSYRPAASSSVDPALERDPRDGGSMPTMYCLDTFTYKYIHTWNTILHSTVEVMYKNILIPLNNKCRVVMTGTGIEKEVYIRK